VPWVRVTGKCVIKISNRLKSQISNRFAALEYFDDDDDDDDDDDISINRAWKGITEDMKASVTDCLGYCQFTQHKPWYDEKCS
jgi:hypothetical protein